MNQFSLRLKRFVDKCNKDLDREKARKPKLPGLPKLYNLEVRDLENTLIKTLAWRVTLPEAYRLMGRFQRSKLILENEGNYTLHHTEIIEVD